MEGVCRWSADRGGGAGASVASTRCEQATPATRCRVTGCSGGRLGCGPRRVVGRVAKGRHCGRRRNLGRNASARMRNRATSRDVNRRGTTPPSSGNGLVWPPSLTRRPTGTPAHRRHAADRMLAWPARLPCRSVSRRSIHPDRAWSLVRLPAELGAGGLGQVAERLALLKEDHRPVLQVQRGGGMVGVDRELQRPARLVSQAHLPGRPAPAGWSAAAAPAAAPRRGRPSRLRGRGGRGRPARRRRRHGR